MNQFHGIFLDIFHFLNNNFYGKYMQKNREIDLLDFTNFWFGCFKNFPALSEIAHVFFLEKDKMRAAISLKKSLKVLSC